MTLRLKRNGKLFFMKDGRRLAPLSPEAYYNAIMDKIKEVESTGDQRELPYEEALEMLKGICSDELRQLAGRFDEDC